MKNFSLFLNTRKRVNLLSNLISSISDTTKDLDSIELIISVDDDDKQTISFLDKIVSDINFDLTVLQQPRPDNLHKSINHMASIAKGHALFVLNDDVEFMTQDWDSLTIESMGHSFWGAAYIKTYDTSIDKMFSSEYSSFPILTKPAYNSIQYFMSEQFVSHGADVHLWRLCDELGWVFDSPILLDHVLHSSEKAIRKSLEEETAKEAVELTFSNFVNCWEVDVTAEAEAIKKRLCGC